MDVQSLQQMLLLERAAREELERHTVLKTRELWKERELRMAQQRDANATVAVLRASLALAHSARHVKQQQQQPLQQQPSDLDAPAAPTDQHQQPAQQQQPTQQPLHQLQQPAADAAAAAACQDAAAKLQPLLEQLSVREPTVAAELSVISWQLSHAAAAAAAPADSRIPACTWPGATGSGRVSDGSIGGGEQLHPQAVLTGSDPLSACEQGTAATGGEAQVQQELRLQQEQEQAQEQALPRHQEVQQQEVQQQTLPQQQQVQQQQEVQQQQQLLEVPPMQQPEQHSQASAADELAAAARLFCGAAAAEAPGAPADLQWWHLDQPEQGGQEPVMRGPYDAAVMLRWLCGGCLEGSLPVAGVLQRGDGSPAAPASVEAFTPLAELLAAVQAGARYSPCPAAPAPAAAPSLPVSTLATDEQPHAPAAPAGSGRGGVLEELVRSWLNLAAASAQSLPGALPGVSVVDYVLGAGSRNVADLLMGGGRQRDASGG